MTLEPPNPMRALLQRALGRIEELERQLVTERRERHEPVALLGAACRLPGGVRSPEGLWRLLDAGADAVTEISAARWPLPPARRTDSPQARSARWAGQIDDVDGFDAAFFGISPREALTMDPQHRLLLEVSWEALEDAGIQPRGLLGSRAGVFVGATAADYLQRVIGGDPADLDAYAFTGNQPSIAAGRISYTFGFQGPCMVLDTACSSSLVAVHQAVMSLRAGESTLALAGGVNLVLDPTHMLMASRLSALSPEGRCKTFDAGADGFARGEGCVMLVLKRLSDALRDGDPIQAVLHGTAINQDGRSTGLTAPNLAAQRDLLCAALRDASVSAGQIDYVEEHGTGTPLGDPIELEALREVLGGPRPDGSRCVVGSVKVNLGHTEAAAGVTGLLKVLVSLRHGRIPRHVGFETLNPRISLEGTALALPIEATPWPAGARKRYAGVSSFGLSGTNAHVILGDPPPRAEAPPAPDRGVELVTLSARTPEALRGAAAAWRDHLRSEEGRGQRLRDIAATTALRRTHFERRLALVGASHEALADTLQGWLEEREGPSFSATGAAAEGARPRVALVFPGQGSQWVGMGRGLYRDEPVFRDALQACEQALAPFTDGSLIRQLHDDGEGALARIDVIQPTLFALSWALAALWRSWGFEPDAVVGHSMGEVAAAAVAGALTLPDAARVIGVRSRLLRRIAGQGAMALVELSRAEAEEAIAGHEDKVSVAVCNSPRATVLSGDPEALEGLMERLSARGVFTRRVKVDVASHSPQVDPLTPDLLRELAPVQPQAGSVDFYSTVDPSVGLRPRLDARYWVQNLRAPVRFADAIGALLEGGHTLFIECSPHPLLVPSIDTILRERGSGAIALPSLRRDHDDRASLLEALARAYAQGASPAWGALHAPPATPLALPAYPWQRERFWIPLPDGEAAPRPGALRGGHPLLAVRFRSSVEPGTTSFEGLLRADRPGWIADHQVGGAVVLPATAMLEAAVAAAQRDGVARELRAVELREALVLADEGPRRVQLVLTRADGRERFRLSSQAVEGEADWTLHAEGELAPPEARPAEPLAEIRARLRVSRPVEACYDDLAARGLSFGPAFQGLRELWVGEGEGLARAQATEPVAADAGEHPLHPALLDSALQAVLAAGPAAAGVGYVPVAARRVRLPVEACASLWSHLRVQQVEVDAPHLPPSLEADVTLYGEDGDVLGELEGLRLRPLERRAGAEVTPLWTVQWSAAPPLETQAALTTPAIRPTRWLVLVRPEGRGRAVGEALAARGHHVTWVVPGPTPRALGADRWEVDLSRPEAFDEVVRAAFSTTEPNGGALHLLGLDAALPPDPEGAALAALWDEGVGSALHLVQALGRVAWRNPPRLHLVTRGASPHGGGASAPWLSPLHGLGLALAYEQPELRCKGVDLPLEPDAADLDALRAELESEDREDRVALRGGLRQAARLAPRAWGDGEEPLAPGARPVFPLRGDGAWLITGGLGGLGLPLGRWLGERGAGRIVLAGRSVALGPEQARALEAIRETGAEVEVVALDVADRAAVEALVGDLGRRGVPLRGVVHAAVVLRDGLLAQQDLGRFREVMAPRILGAYNLHRATRSLDLDHFILYGSAAATLGSPGQSSYMAASSFLGALAEHRRASGLPALCVDWGAFSEVGAAAAQANRGERLGFRGLRGISPAEGEAWLGRLMAGAEVRVGVLALDARQWLEFHPQVAHQPWFSALREQAGRASPGAFGRSPLRTQLDAASSDQRALQLERYVREQAAAVLRLPPARVDLDTPLKTYGVDSLMGLELRNRFELGLGLRLSATIVWSYPTVSALAGFLEGQLWPAAPAAPTAPAAGPPAEAEAAPSADRVEALLQLSDEEKEALIEAKLSALEDLL